MEFFGILSGILYNISSVFSIIKVLRQGHARDLMNVFFYPWYGGCFTGLLYSYHISDIVLMFNFGVGFVAGTIILRYKLFPR